MNLTASLPIFAAIVVFTIVVLVHLGTHEVPYMPNWAWAALIVLTMPIGGIIYLLVIGGVGTQREDAEGRGPNPKPNP